MKSILEKILALFTKQILNKYRPKVIGITGSVGKSSTKEAIYTVLKNKFRVRRNIKNYNNEIGLPLTIIGAAAAGKSIVKWSLVFLKALKLIVVRDKNYPEILILEMGADHPGDINYLVKLVPCTIGVVTRVAPAHVEYFGSVEAIAKEKRKVVSHLKKNGIAVLNFDDARVSTMAKVTKAKVLKYGYGEGADVRAIELEQAGEGLELSGLRFKVTAQGSTVPMFVPGVIGRHQVYAALAATAVGLGLGLNLVEIAGGLKDFQPPKGRMTLIPGKNNSMIIDDTYNSSPVAASAAANTTAGLAKEDNRLVAIVGDMLELGEMAEEAHYNLGNEIAELGFNLLLCVGKNRQATMLGAKEKGLTAVKGFDTADQAAAYYIENIKPADLILVKGSQGSRMEKLVKKIMAEPSLAKDVLVRQTDEWLQR